jgi:hypothetical protein
VKRDELQAIQAQSTILYLPQAFSSDAPTMIRHNFPTKMLDYVRARRPILVHSPSDSYLTRMAREHGFAKVVDQPNEDALRRGLVDLLNDTGLQRQLVKNAVAFAKTRDSFRWSSDFFNILMGREDYGSP